MFLYELDPLDVGKDGLSDSKKEREAPNSRMKLDAVGARTVSVV